MKLDWKDIVATVAPVIGSALPFPPFGQMALKHITQALGIPDGSSEKVIGKAVANATPEQMATLKQLNNEFDVKMKELDVNILELEAKDRDSAREREIKTGDNTPKILAYALTVGFFSLLGTLIFYDVPIGNKDLINIALGMLGAGYTGVITYYFGSSASSAKKTKLLSKE